MSLSRRSLSMLPAIRRARTAPRKLTSTIRALEPWKYPKSLHQGKNEKNGIAEAIPFLSCPTMFSYREAPFRVWCFLLNCGDRIWRSPHGLAHGDPNFPASAWDIFTQQKKTPEKVSFLLNCGDRIWTCDLRVMSPTSYRTALLRGSIKNGRRRIRTFEAIATDLQSAPFGHSGIHPCSVVIFRL